MSASVVSDAFRLFNSVHVRSVDVDDLMNKWLVERCVERGRPLAHKCHRLSRAVFFVLVLQRVVGGGANV